MNIKRSKEAAQLEFEIIDALLRHMGVHFSELSWKIAYVDFRSLQNANSRIHKFRIELTDDTIVKDQDTPLDHSLLFKKLWAIRDSAYSQIWQGIKVAVYPNGSSKVEYNHDVDCANDAAFYDAD